MLLSLIVFIFAVLFSKHLDAKCIDVEIVEDIKKELNLVNPYVQHYRCAANHLQKHNVSSVKLCLLSSRKNDGRLFNIPVASKVAALIVGDIDMDFN